MTEEVDFLFDHQLIAAVEKLIRSAKHKLVLISPFIDLDARIVDALNEKKALHNFELQVLFGKNEANYLRSIKRDSLEFFKEFPNVEIRYNERLHAKFYQNDFEYIITSLNLYDYSLANNIEVGIRIEHSMKGILGKALDSSFSLIEQGVDKVKQDVLGMNKQQGPIEKFQMIFEASELKYKTQPVVVEKGGIQGLIGQKRLDGFEVVVNKLAATSIPASSYTTTTTVVNTAITASSTDTQEKTVEGRYLSASQIGKTAGLQTKDVNNHMQQKGLVNGEQITELGKTKGLIFKTYMGNKYIAYPEQLAEIK